MLTLIWNMSVVKVFFVGKFYARFKSWSEIRFQELNLMSRKNLTAHLPKTYCESSTSAHPDHFHRVAVLQELPLLPTRPQGNSLGSPPRKLQHRAKGPGLRSGDGSGGEKISRSHVAPGHCVVSKLLLHRPVHVSEVGLRHSAPLPVLGVDLNIQLDVEGEGIGMAEVWKWCWVLFVVCHRKWLQSLHGDHPRRDGGPQVLGPKRSERNIFPLLDVPRRPVIHEDHSEDVLVCLLGGDGLAQGRAVATNEESHLQLKVHQATWAKLGWLGVNRPGLSIWPSDRCARNDNGRGSTMVANWEMLPVWHQCIILATKHCPDIGCMVKRGVEISVVTNVCWQMHLC